MGARLLEIIRQVGIFMICAQMLLHFKPTESYGKYIKLLVSIMVLVQIFVPVMEIFGKSGHDAFQGKVLFYDEIMEESMNEINITSVTAEKLLEQMTLEEVKTRINNQEIMDEQELQENSIEIQSETLQIQNQDEANIIIDRIEVTTGE